jgi:hypothetical protein
MYGTVAQMKVKAGHQDDLIKLIGEWNAERAPKISGAVSGYMVRLDSDPQDMMMIGIFESKNRFRITPTIPNRTSGSSALWNTWSRNPSGTTASFLRASLTHRIWSGPLSTTPAC